MDTQPVRWWNGQNEMTRRLGSGLAVCGTVVGALYMIVETAPTERAMRFFDDGGRIAVSQAKPLDRPVSNQLQVAVDASPAGQMLSVPIPTPSPLASAKIAPPAKHVAMRAEAEKPKVADAGSVELFNRCLPQCETRDPMIAGGVESTPQEPMLVAGDPPPVVEERDGFRPLAGARHLLIRAVDAPGIMLRRSRQAIDSVARLDW
ncbi:hypothetical protein HGP17_14415 [Rhizobium sp. P38BS-XIX]|uniref:hypothetical protein n=1 Tax=Rhizobium sp. P38BS-XIX TaxID=2726740 RepID=UPI001457421D|nr:hypothetical protein [Rhizobium sp. P38BS-XIX]NLR98010.1 hypothetical protein [Rhizobium sp. P38BS-XIX]